jgi:DNA topoisomerase-1
MATMIIAEKAKAAEAIAESLGNVQKLKPNKRVSVFYVPKEDLYVIPLRGHIQQYENTSIYKKWTDRDPREIITNPNAIEKHSNKYAGPYISALQKYAKICDKCIIGTDADVEGCNIGMIDALPFVKSVKPSVKITQLWLNDLQKSSIVKAYANQISPKWGWAYSAEARAIIDAVIGFSATREVTLTLNPILRQINTKFASIGRVQTCLLYLLYLREKLIRDFKPQPFWKIICDISLLNKSLRAEHLKNNFSDQKIAESIFNKIKNEKFAIIKDIRQNKKTVPLPKPLNTSSALQLLTKHTKMNSKTALKTLEDLYLDKIISYPRTDSNKYSNEYDHKTLISKFLTNTKYNQYAKNLILNNKIYPNQGKKDAGDHSPITPLMSLEDNSSKLKTQFHKQAYQLITQHYLSLFGEPAIELDLKLLLLVKDEPFMIKLKGILKDGFYGIAPFYKKKYDLDQELSEEQISHMLGSQVPIKNIENQEKQTIPPSSLF